MKKAFIIVLAAVMLLPLMFSCGNDGDISISDSSADSTASQNSDPDVPVKDMGGREFRVLCPDFGAGSNSILGYTGEVLYSEENPDSVDEAKKAVIERVQNDYNCKIDGIVDSATPVFQTVRNQVSSGNIEYDIVFDSTGNAAVLALEHNLYDLKDISTIDLSASWWDQNAVNDLALGGHLYFVMGDINTYDNQGTWCMIFNKDLKRKLGISEDFYALARDGKWDFDTFAEICRRDGISRDLNSDGVMDEKDQWAFGTETYNIYVHYISAGKKIALPDGDGIPYLTMNTDMTATANILTHVLDFYNEKETVMVANHEPYTNKGFSNVWEATVHKAFLEGRELFYMCGLINIASFRKMDDEFGILPVPKYDPAQVRYYHTVSVGNSSAMFIPYGVKDVEDVGLIVSALSKESKALVTPAYMDVQLKYRDAKDEESAEMLDIIFNSRTFDLGSVYNWGYIITAYTSMDKNIASRFEAIASSAQAKLDEAIKDIT